MVKQNFWPNLLLFLPFRFLSCQSTAGKQTNPNLIEFLGLASAAPAPNESLPGHLKQIRLAPADLSPFLFDQSGARRRPTSPGEARRGPKAPRGAQRPRAGQQINLELQTFLNSSRSSGCHLAGAQSKTNDPEMSAAATATTTSRRQSCLFLLLLLLGRHQRRL